MAPLATFRNRYSSLLCPHPSHQANFTRAIRLQADIPYLRDGLPLLRVSYVDRSSLKVVHIINIQQPYVVNPAAYDPALVAALPW